MGNCFPAQKNKDPDMKLKTSISSKENNSKVTGDHDSMEFNNKLQSPSPIPLSNKEEMFFDSQTWLESDIEDFLSVNGDSTPLGGTTPDRSSNKNPESDELLAETSPTPTEMKKQLIELFRESFSDAVDETQNVQERTTEAKLTTSFLPSNCKNTNAYESVNNSICSKQTQPNPGKSKPAQSTHCCLPNLVRSLSSSSERKKKMSRAYSRGQS